MKAVVNRQKLLTKCVIKPGKNFGREFRDSGFTGREAVGKYL